MYEWLRGGARAAMDKIMKIGRESTIPDQWATQIMARIQLKHTVIFVAERDHQIIEDMGFRAVSTLEEAFAAAEEIAGAEAKITVIPDGVAVIVR
jgi:nickel-dependent lactate racemase